MLGKLNNTEIEEVLHNQILGRIGCSANDVTYIVPTSYAYEDNYIYAHSKNGKKLDIMRENPKVCFEVEAFSHMADWKTVIVWGRFEEITDALERKNALQILHRRHLPLIPSETVKLSQYWPFTPGDINSIGGTVYRIAIEEKTGRFENIEEDNAASGTIEITNTTLAYSNR